MSGFLPGLAPNVPAGVWASVAVDGPFLTALTYRVPTALIDRVRRGIRVVVPFREGARTGVVLSLAAAPPSDLDASRIRDVGDAVDFEPIVPEAQLALAEWIARYYHAPVGECVRMTVPASADVEASRVIRLLPGPRPSGIPAASERGAGGSPRKDAASEDRAALLLAALEARSGAVEADELLGLVRGARAIDLHALECTGRVQSDYHSRGERHRARQALRVARGERSDGARLGEKQTQVLRFLDEHGEADAGELRALFGTDAGTLRSLERRALVRLTSIDAPRDPFGQARCEPRSRDPDLTRAQLEAISAIDSARAAADGSVVLLHGVTGSGKTEVYLRAVRAVRALGGRSLLLLPEIALTPQFVGIFRQDPDLRVAVLHSGLTPAQRADQWRVVRLGSIDVVIGARSALFAPITDLRLIVVDEEHDSSFKQEEGVRYHARDAAIVLARSVGAAVVLGSATPSLESIENANRGRYRLVRMPERVQRRPMPTFERIDMRAQATDPTDPAGRFLSAPLQAAVRDTVAAGEQAILFLNRRGWAPTVECEHCGEAILCANCDISMTFHRRGNLLRCHYCGAAAAMVQDCPSCGSDRLDKSGVGTQQVEEIVAAAFAPLRVARLDRDSGTGAGLARILADFRARRTDVLIGTQMVTKGHDFPDVTLVGVLDADQSLRFPDFRSGERTFQLLTQVAGRAGRGDRAGRVLVQTYRPEHFVIDAAARGDFDGFVKSELEFRRRLGYPPFGHLMAVKLDAPEYAPLRRAAEDLAARVESAAPRDVRWLGPVDAPLARLRGRNRMQLLARASSRAPIHAAAQTVLVLRAEREPEWRKSGVRLAVDIDPLSLL